jgi:hypothetical protein
VLSDPAAQSGARICQHSLRGTGEQRQIGGAVADVGKTILSKTAVKDREFLMPSEVCRAIAGQDTGENAKMLSYAFGETHVCAGGEVKLASADAFVLKEVEKAAVVREMNDVEFNMCSDKSFEAGFSVKQGSGKMKEEARMGSSEDQERVNEGVGFDERAIQIHAEWLGADRCCVRLGQDLRQRLPRVGSPAEEA